MRKIIYCLLSFAVIMAIKGCTEPVFEEITLGSEAVVNTVDNIRTPEDAVAEAEHFLNSLAVQTRNSTTRGKPVVTSVKFDDDVLTRSVAANEQADLYVVNFASNSGFALVPTNPVAPPILGGSGSGNFSADNAVQCGL